MCKDNSHSPRNCQCKGSQMRGFLQPRLLLYLAQKTAHGYELMEALGKFPDLSIDPGSLYRTLRSLEEDDLVCSSWDTSNAGPARRVYELTDLGRDYLHTWAVDIQKTRQRLDDFLAEYQNCFPERRSSL